ncbi:MAG: iron ABC transporter permease [Acetatifactor sp.]|nr:iron ABC transporter permease [Acetatifactor sp.]
MRKGYFFRRRKYVIICIILCLLVTCLCLFEMSYGKTTYSIPYIFKVLGSSQAMEGDFTIRTLRFPRVLAGLLTGMAFGMAGNTFQKLLRNPLASPDIIGVTSGASVAAVFGILVLGISGTAVSLMAVISGFAVTCFIYMASGGSRHNGLHFNGGRLILIGIGVQAFLNAIISWMLLKTSEYNVAAALRWLSGNLNDVSMERIPILGFILAVAGTGILLLNRQLQVMQLGEEFSYSLGTKPETVRLLLMLCALFLTAFATAVSGPIASVAFLSGPIARRVTGDGRGNMMASAFTGAILVLLADIVGQYALPARYPVGVITGIMGAPYLLILLLRMNGKGVSES